MIRQKKIVSRLILSYTFLLGVFTVIMLTIFFSLFNKQGLKLHQEQMKEQGEVIAETIVSEGYLDNLTSQKSMHNRMMSGNSHMSGVNPFLSLISNLSTDEIYVVNLQGEPLFSSHMSNHNNQLGELPLSGKEVLSRVTENDLSQFIEIEGSNDKYTLGYGVPLKNETNELMGSVIVLSKKAHSITKNLSDYRLLIGSIMLALVITIVVSISLAKRFIKPIHEMDTFIDTLIQSNYGESIQIETKDELSELGDKLSILSSRLLVAQKEQNNKEKNQKMFLSQISHELRTPVMVIKNSLEGLQGDFLDENDKEEYITQLLQETNQMSRLVNDLLELTRLESTDFSINKELISLPDVCQDSIRSFRTIIKQKNQQIELVNGLTESDTFMGDYQRMSQLIKLLIDNSVKYSPMNSLILVQLDKNEQHLFINVTNVVENISDVPEEKDMLQAFKRGKNNEIVGHGLGLKIAEEITKRHNGIIKISKIGKNQLKISLIFDR